VEPTITCATTPSIFDVQPSVPVTDGAACTSDLDCDTGAFCSAGASGNACHTSGLLQRGDIYYVAGPTLDLTMLVSACGSISDVLQGGTSLGGSGGFDDTGQQYSVLSSTATTYNGQDATRIVVRINLLNFGDGTSAGYEVRVAAPVQTATANTLFVAGTTKATSFGSTASKKFTVAGVAAVNAAMRATIGETAMRTNFAVSMYNEFGDGDEVWKTHDDGTMERVAWDLDWSDLGTTLLNNQVHYTGTDLRIEQGQVAFSMKFNGPGLLCDTTIDVDGAFTLAPARQNMTLQWLLPPKGRVDAGTACSLLTFGIDAIITDIIVAATGVEDQIGNQVKLQMEGNVGVQDGVIPVCPTCIVQAVQIGDGRIDIYATPGFDSVRVNVGTDRLTDRTSDPNNMGLIIPPATYALVMSGGTYRSCVTADGTPAATCAGMMLDASGTFNWWGSDVPVPTPWPTGANGQIGYIGARADAWNRLVPLGVTRHAEQLPSPTLAAGMLLARSGGGAAGTPGPRLRVKPGCMIPPDSIDITTAVPTRIALGINDLPVVGTEPPTSGKLDATVLIPDYSLSQIAFSSATACPAEPPAPLQVLGGLGDLNNVATVGGATLAN
jgi:hypothetical protein